MWTTTKAPTDSKISLSLYLCLCRFSSLMPFAFAFPFPFRCVFDSKSIFIRIPLQRNTMIQCRCTDYYRVSCHTMPPSGTPDDLITFIQLMKSDISCCRFYLFHSRSCFFFVRFSFQLISHPFRLVGFFCFISVYDNAFQSYEPFRLLNFNMEAWKKTRNELHWSK